MSIRTSETSCTHTLLNERRSFDPNEVLRILVEQSYEAEVKYATFITNDRALAEDAVQQALIEIWPRIQGQIFGTQNDEALRRARRYLRNIVHSRACDAVRPKSIIEISGTVSNPEEHDYKFGYQEAPFGEEIHPQIVLTGIGLRKDEIQLVMLIHDGYSLVDVANLLGTPLGTIKSRMSRIRTKIRQSQDPFWLDALRDYSQNQTPGRKRWTKSST